MLKHYLTISLRNLFRSKAFSSINILGLALGMSCAVLLVLYIQDELSYDAFVPDAPNRYRVNIMWHTTTQDLLVATAQGKFSTVMQNDLPEVKSRMRVLFYSQEAEYLLKYQEQKIIEKAVIRADSNFFEFFPHRFLRGNPQTALTRSDQIVLSKSTALKLFGSLQNAMGELIELDEELYQVSGITEDSPANTHMPFRAVVSVLSIDQEYRENTYGNVFWTYVHLQEGSNPQEISQRSSQVLHEKLFQKAEQKVLDIELQALRDVRLHSSHIENNIHTSNVIYVYALSAIALITIILAIINYVNLATARSIYRAKEIGIRKLIGSQREQLIGQFMTESFLLTFFAACLGLLFVNLSLPLFKQFSEKSLYFSMGETPGLVLLYFATAGLIGLVSGMYPAWIISAYVPVQVLKGRFSHNKKGIRVRRALVIVQFTVSIVMIMCTWIVYRQTQFMLHKDLGFQGQEVIALPNLEAQKSRYIEEKISQSPHIIQVAQSNAVPGKFGLSYNAFRLEGEGEQEEQIFNNITYHWANAQYLDVMGIPLREGRNFDATRPTDTASVIVNEQVVQLNAWQNPIGKRIKLGDRELKVIGVIPNIHYKSLHEAMDPLIIMYQPEHWFRVIAKIQAGKTEEVLANLKDAWEDVEKDYPFESFFLRENFSQQYIGDINRGNIFFSFTVLALIIACLGVLGLALYNISQRLKEIGIRKILGASVYAIIRLITQDFVRLILVAGGIALPIAWYFMNLWLENYAYRIELVQQWHGFILATFIAIFIALFTISWQIYFATRVNPVEILRDE